MSQDSQKPDAQPSNQAQLFIVIRRTGGGECKIVPESDKYPSIFTKVYGPTSYGKCEAWVAENCREPEPPQ